MGRVRVLRIRALLQFYSSYRIEEAVVDPLWQSRSITDHFLKNCTDIAVPGVYAFNENTVRCRVRTAAKSCKIVAQETKQG